MCQDKCFDPGVSQSCLHEGYEDRVISSQKFNHASPSPDPAVTLTLRATVLCSVALIHIMGPVRNTGGGYSELGIVVNLESGQSASPRLTHSHLTAEDLVEVNELIVQLWTAGLTVPQPDIWLP